MAAAYLIAVLFLVIMAAEWLALNTVLRQVGTALLVVLLAAVLANAGVIPSASDAPPLYAGVFHYVAPFAIFLLLLEVDLRRLRQAGLPMLAAFAAGVFATVCGVLLAVWITPLDAALGELAPAVGGMFAATYTGGSVNFNALALHYEITGEGALYAGALAVDNIMTMIWMAVTLALPRLLGAPRAAGAVQATAAALPAATIDVFGLAALGALAAGAIWIADLAADYFAALGLAIPSILVLTTIALVLAQSDRIRQLGGAKTIAMLSLHLFLAVIGAHAEIAALIEIGQLGLLLLGFASVLLLTHGALMLLTGLLVRDWDVIAIASQANIGGATTAIALAEIFERDDLALPAILVGSLGMAVGSYVGFAVATLLGA